MTKQSWQLSLIDPDGIAYHWQTPDHAVMLWGGLRLGEYVRFRRGHYLFMGDSYRRFPSFGALSHHFRRLVEAVSGPKDFGSHT